MRCKTDLLSKYSTMKKLLFVFLAISFASCNESVSDLKLKTGLWRATLNVQDGKQLPFLFNWTQDQKMIIHNAEERIEVDDVTINGDSITIAHPVFEGVFKGVFTPEAINGVFVKPSLDRVVPFRMLFGQEDRFKTDLKPSQDVTGNWEMVFSAHSPEDKYIAKGIFTQTKDQKVTGTIRTTTGDYRYLEGVMDGDTMKLSTFDGAHAFLFEAQVKDSLLYGFFYSGNHWREPFSATKNENYELPDANDLTFLKEGYDAFDFSFPNTKGELVSLSDDRFSNKVVVVQIMGTWCPNCLEETQFYADYLKKHPSDKVEFVALAFEYTPTKELAVKGINRLREAVGVPYPILLAQYGSSSKQKANEKLPMLNHVLSYPTTIFIDKKGSVRKIHTGFNGKATGEKFETFSNEFEEFMNELVSEETNASV